MPLAPAFHANGMSVGMTFLVMVTCLVMFFTVIVFITGAWHLEHKLIEMTFLFLQAPLLAYAFPVMDIPVIAAFLVLVACLVELFIIVTSIRALQGLSALGLQKS